MLIFLNYTFQKDFETSQGLLPIPYLLGSSYKFEHRTLKFSIEMSKIHNTQVQAVSFSSYLSVISTLSLAYLSSCSFFGFGSMILERLTKFNPL